MATRKRLNLSRIRRRKVRDGAEPLVMVTAYDYPSARIADEGSVDLILVGDTLGMVVLGHDDTTRVDLDIMGHHVRAVARAEPSALIIGDMPWLTYHTGWRDAVRNAGELMRAGAEAVKIEGGHARLRVVQALQDAEIPVMGHLGLTPQSRYQLGTLARVQGKTPEHVREIVEDARLLADAGCFAVVLEAMPAEAARLVTESIPIPTIGIGAGPGCDGQVLVFHDLLGLEDRLSPSFVRRYAELKQVAVEGMQAFADDVRSGRYPSPKEEYALPEGVTAESLRAEVTR